MMNERPMMKFTGPLFLSSGVHLFLKKVVESAIAIGGTIPPIITEAIIIYEVSEGSLTKRPVAITYAALLNGPPISIAIIPASSAQTGMIRPLSFIIFTKSVIP